jgi:hypothetical protein
MHARRNAGLTGLLYLAGAAPLLLLMNIVLVCMLRTICRGGCVNALPDWPKVIEPRMHAALYSSLALLSLLLSSSSLVSYLHVVHAHPFWAASASFPTLESGDNPSHGGCAALQWLLSLLLGVPARLVLFSCSVVFSTTVWVAWQYGPDSCFFDSNQHILWFR